MKSSFIISFLILLCAFNLNAQTNANIAGSENVLVVYSQPIDDQDTVGLVSEAVMEYYVNARNIPASNIVPLNNLDVSDTVSFPSGAVWMDDYKEVYISDDNKAAWECYVDKIKTPIENHLNTTIVNGVVLKNTIRYIVMCKGVPIKLQAYIDFDADLDPDPNVESNPSYWTKYNVSVDALTCLLYNPVINLYGTSYNSLSNPYYIQADMSFHFNERFLTNYFHNGSWYVNYLVTRLDGNSYNDIIGMIDRANASDYAGNKWWILDADTCHNEGVTKSVHNQNLIKNSLNRLKSYGFNTNPIDYDPSCEYILDNSVGINESVMGYTSCGRHAWMMTCNPENNPAYIQICLDFDYANGAVFNTFESMNGFSMYINNRYGDHGMVSEFIKMGGSCGLGHTWEPLLGGIAKNDNLFNLYQMGYSFADAAYQSIPYLAWNNVVIGDPLTTIAWGKQSLTSNLNWSGTNLVTGEIYIADLKTLNIANNSVINLRHQGFITGDGKLIAGQNVTFNIYDWQKGLFLSYDGSSPRLIWGAHPSLNPTVNYKIYRKVGTTGSWVLITTTTSLEYTDTQIQFSQFGEGSPNVFYKILAYSELPTTYESNIVTCYGEKSAKERNS